MSVGTKQNIIRTFIDSVLLLTSCTRADVNLKLVVLCTEISSCRTVAQCTLMEQVFLH